MDFLMIKLTSILFYSIWIKVLYTLSSKRTGFFNKKMQQPSLSRWLKQLNIFMIFK